MNWASYGSEDCYKLKKVQKNFKNSKLSNCMKFYLV